MRCQACDGRGHVPFWNQDERFLLKNMGSLVLMERARMGHPISRRHYERGAIQQINLYVRAARAAKEKA